MCFITETFLICLLDLGIADKTLTYDVRSGPKMPDLKSRTYRPNRFGIVRTYQSYFEGLWCDHIFMLPSLQYCIVLIHCLMFVFLDNYGMNYYIIVTANSFVLGEVYCLYSECTQWAELTTMVYVTTRIRRYITVTIKSYFNIFPNSGSYTMA